MELLNKSNKCHHCNSGPYRNTVNAGVEIKKRPLISDNIVSVAAGLPLLAVCVYLSILGFEFGGKLLESNPTPDSCYVEYDKRNDRFDVYASIPWREDLIITRFTSNKNLNEAREQARQQALDCAKNHCTIK